MALPKALVQLPFVGLNTIVDPKNSPAGTYEIINNSLMTRTTELVKRSGTTLLTAALSNVRQAYTLNTEQGIVTSSNLESYDPINQQMINKGTTIAPSLNASPIIANTYSQSTPDYGISDSGVFGSTWLDSSGGVKCTIQSTYSGGFIVSNYMLDANGSLPRVVGAGNFLVFFWANGSTLLANAYNTVTNQFQSSNVTIESSLAATIVYDTIKSGVNVLIAAVTTNASPNSIFGYYFNTLTGTLGNNTFGTAAPISLGMSNTSSGVASISLALSPDTTYFTCTYIGNSNSIYTRPYYPYLSPIIAESTVTSASTDTKKYVTSCLDGSNNTYFFYSTYSSLNNSYQSQQINNITSPTTSLDQAFIYYMSVISKAWYYSGRPHVILNYFSNLQNTYFGVTFAGDCFARILTNNGAETIAPSHPPISVIPLPGLPDQYSTCLLRATKIVSSGTGYSVTPSLYNVTFNYTYQLNSPPVQLNGNLNIVGGYLHQYDGATTIYEQGFHLYPEAPTLTQSNSTGSLTMGGAYEYLICWEWVDNAGLLHRSAPSVPTNITLTGSNNTVTITVPPLPLTAKCSRFNNTRSNVVMAVYRTLTLGTTLYRVNPLQANYVYNNPASPTVLSFTDGISDSALQNNPILYTNGGVFANIATPAANLQITSKNRLWLADVDTFPNEVFPSKQLQPGIAAEFSTENSIFIDGYGGKITALASMDDTILFFKHSNIFSVGGEGPDPTGNNGSFTTPVLISSDVGCPYPTSTILTKTGIMFQSNKGIYQVDRQFNVTYIGAPVQKYTQTAGTYVTSATTDPDSNLVYFALNTGQVLVYNTFFQLWFTQSYPVSIQAMTWSQYGFLLSGLSSLYLQNSSTYGDGPIFVQSDIRTTWIQMNQLEGFGRLYNIYLSGDNAAISQKLIVNLYYDFETYPRQTLSIDPSDFTGSTYGTDTPYGQNVYGGFYDGTFQFQIRPITQKCSSIRIEISDQSLVGMLTQSFKLSGVTLEVGIKPTGNKNLSVNRRLQ